MTREEAWRRLEQAKRDQPRLQTAAAAFADQIDAMVRDNFAHIGRIVREGPDARKALGDDLFDAVARVMAVKIVAETAAGLKDELEDLESRP